MRGKWANGRRLLARVGCAQSGRGTEGERCPMGDCGTGRWSVNLMGSGRVSGRESCDLQEDVLSSVHLGWRFVYHVQTPYNLVHTCRHRCVHLCGWVSQFYSL